MEQYIPKDALVAEIEKQIETLINKKKNLHIEAWNWSIDAEIKDYNSILSFIDTLEVKEVDLEKHLKEDIEDVFFDLNGVAVKGATHCLTVEDVKDIAKHFYELGMVASNKTQKGEEV